MHTLEKPVANGLGFQTRRQNSLLFQEGQLKMLKTLMINKRELTLLYNEPFPNVFPANSMANG
jgi:hypothetical protein